MKKTVLKEFLKNRNAQKTANIVQNEPKEEKKAPKKVKKTSKGDE